MTLFTLGITETDKVLDKTNENLIKQKAFIAKSYTYYQKRAYEIVI